MFKDFENPHEGILTPKIRRFEADYEAEDELEEEIKTNRSE